MSERSLGTAVCVFLGYSLAAPGAKGFVAPAQRAVIGTTDRTLGGQLRASTWATSPGSVDLDDLVEAPDGHSLGAKTFSGSAGRPREFVWKRHHASARRPNAPQSISGRRWVRLGGH